MSEIILVYVGDQGAIVPGVPACDLTADDIKASGFTAEQLCAYSPTVYSVATKPKPATKQVKAEGK